MAVANGSKIMLIEQLWRALPRQRSGLAGWHHTGIWLLSTSFEDADSDVETQFTAAVFIYRSNDAGVDCAFKARGFSSATLLSSGFAYPEDEQPRRHAYSLIAEK
jgi:hypothetical protein